MNPYFAASDGNLECLRSLVTAANVDVANDEGFTLLHLACWRGHHHVAAWLVRVGADLNARDRERSTPLHVAAHNAHPRCVQVLLEAGADPSIRDEFGWMPLHLAYKSAECTGLLIAAYPAGVKQLDGHTVLHKAVNSRSLDVSRMLIDAGCAVDGGSIARTPLWRAFYFENRGDSPAQARIMAEMLLDRGAQLERIKLDSDLNGIPNWAVAFVARRRACRSSCWAVLELARRCSRDIGGNRRDVLQLIARMIWDSRRDKLWEDKKQKKPVKK